MLNSSIILICTESIKMPLLLKLTFLLATLLNSATEYEELEEEKGVGLSEVVTYKYLYRITMHREIETASFVS